MGCQSAWLKAQLHRLKLSVLVIGLAQFSPVASAGEKENSIINRAIEAYGGSNLLQLQSVQLTDDMEHFSPWQSGHSGQGFMIMYLTKYQIELTIDLLNKRKVFKQATTRLVGGHGTDTPTLAHRIFVEGKGYDVDHGLQQYQSLKSIDYNNVDMGNGQLLDPLIIRRLDEERNNSRWTDTAYIQGEAHYVLTVDAGTKEEYVLYLNQNSGYLTRMLKKRGKQLRSYDFLDHRKSQGIVWAKQLFVSTEEQPLYHTDAREIRFNRAKNEQFTIPSGYKQRPKTQAVDVSRLTIRQLAKDVYFVGQGWGYTLFIDAGEYYISAGSWQMDRGSQAWQKGLDLLRQTTGSDKPVGQHIVTHHHNDHMMGLGDVVKEGADLVLHPKDVAAVKKHLQQPLADSRFVPITETSYLAGGRVMLFDVPNSHASHNLVLYLPEHKLLFTEDMFGSGFQTEFHSPNGWPSIDAYHRLDVLTNEIDRLELEVEQYVSSHHARILDQTEIDRALTMSRPSRGELMKRLFAQDLERTSD